MLFKKYVDTRNRQLFNTITGITLSKKRSWTELDFSRTENVLDDYLMNLAD